MKTFKIILPTKEEMRLSSIKLYFASRKNKTQFCYWYDKIKSSLLEINMPETIVIISDPNDRWQTLDNIRNEQFHKTISRIKEAASKVGYPCFMKDSMYSGKHEWIDTCYIPNSECIENNLCNLIYSAAMVNCDIATHIVVRKYIKTIPAFYAFNKMPITCERRYFVKDGQIYFHHPYWPPFSIENPSCENWELLLSELNFESQEEIKYLSELTIRIGNLLGDGWSVDWLKDEYGKWWLIDMAEDYKSFIWKEYDLGEIGI